MVEGHLHKHSYQPNQSINMFSTTKHSWQQFCLYYNNFYTSTQTHSANLDQKRHNSKLCSYGKHSPRIFRNSPVFLQANNLYKTYES